MCEAFGYSTYHRKQWGTASVSVKNPERKLHGLSPCEYFKTYMAMTQLKISSFWKFTHIFETFVYTINRTTLRK